MTYQRHRLENKNKHFSFCDSSSHISKFLKVKNKKFSETISKVYRATNGLSIVSEKKKLSSNLDVKKVEKVSLGGQNIQRQVLV